MFYHKFLELCDSKSIKPSRAAEEMGFNKSSVTNWKNNGYTPRREILSKISDYFGVSIDYLLESDNQKKPSAENGKGLDKNTVVIVGRDGRRIEKKLSDEQIKALEMMVEQLPPFEL